jgi:hypothetical protein
VPHPCGTAKLSNRNPAVTIDMQRPDGVTPQ